VISRDRCFIDGVEDARSLVRFLRGAKAFTFEGKALSSPNPPSGKRGPREVLTEGTSGHVPPLGRYRGTSARPSRVLHNGRNPKSGGITRNEVGYGGTILFISMYPYEITSEKD